MLHSKDQRKTGRPSRRDFLKLGAAALAGGTVASCCGESNRQRNRFADSNIDINLGDPYKERSPEERRQYYLELYTKFEKTVDQIFPRLMEIGEDIKHEKFPNLLTSMKGAHTLKKGIHIEFCPRKPSAAPDCKLTLATEPDKPYPLCSVAHAFHIYAALCAVQNQMTAEEAGALLTEEEVGNIETSMPEAKHALAALPNGRKRLPEFPTGDSLERFIVSRFYKFMRNYIVKNPHPDDAVVFFKGDEEHLKKAVTELFTAACVYCDVNPHFKDAPSMRFDAARRVTSGQNNGRVSSSHSYLFDPMFDIKIPYTITVIDPKEIDKKNERGNAGRFQ